MTGNKYDEGKLRYSLVPPEVLERVVEVLTFGANKYSDGNWMLVDNAKQRYMDAMMRHFEAYRKGELYDEESGETHLAHAICCLMFIDALEEDLT